MIERVLIVGPAGVSPRAGTWADREVGSGVETVVRGKRHRPPRQARAGSWRRV